MSSNLNFNIAMSKPNRTQINKQEYNNYSKEICLNRLKTENSQTQWFKDSSGIKPELKKNPFNAILK